MPRFSLIIVILLSGYFSLSQDKKFDSLWSVYNNKNQADTNRLIAIHTIAWSFISNMPDSAITIGQQELQFARLKKLKKFEAKAFNVLGASYTTKGIYLKALENYFNALKKFEEIGHKRGIANSYTNIGSIYSNESNYSKALEYY